jgi:putative transposase
MDFKDAVRRFKKGQNSFPKFKSRKNRKQSFKSGQKSYRIENGKIFISKRIGWIPVVQHRPITGNFGNIIISKTTTNKYYVTILSKIDDFNVPEAINQYGVGIDLGLKNFTILSTGEKTNLPFTVKEYENRLKFLNQSFSRKIRDSKGRVREKLRLSKYYEKRTNQRNDFINKLVCSLVSENQVIAIENLRVSNLLKNKKLSKNIAKQSWSDFINRLKVKATQFGRTIHQVSNYFPSTQLCSHCGYRKTADEKLTLKERVYECPECGSVMDRDVNAAVNLINDFYMEACP